MIFIVVDFPAPLGPQQAEYLPVLHRKAQVVHRVVVPIPLHEIFDLDHTNLHAPAGALIRKLPFPQGGEKTVLSLLFTDVSIDRESEIHLKGTSSHTVQNFSRLFLTFGDTLKPSSKEERAKTPLFFFIFLFFSLPACQKSLEKAEHREQQASFNHFPLLKKFSFPSHSVSLPGFCVSQSVCPNRPHL